MPVYPPYANYRDQLRVAALSLGLALWNPSRQKKIYDKVSIDDVGYLHEGTFIRMFNVRLPSNHPLNGTLGAPDLEDYDPLNCGPFTNTIEVHFDNVDYYSRFVSAESNSSRIHARSPVE